MKTPEPHLIHATGCKHPSLRLKMARALFIYEFNFGSRKDKVVI
jgi:hypothetical protein